MNELTLGLDCSVWQTNDAKNPAYFFEPVIAKEKGMQFAIFRVAYETTKDKAVDYFAKRAMGCGLPFGFYQYVTNRIPYAEQADKFIEIIKPYNYTLPLFIDVEDKGVGLEFTKAWCGRVSSKLGKKPAIYTSPSFWNGMAGVDKATWALEYDYWVANYFKSLTFPVYDIPDIVRNSTTLPAPLLPWSKNNKPWKFWQFCAAGDGEFYGGDYAKHTDKTSLDMNVYNGSLAQFNAEFKITDLPDIPDEPPADNTDIDKRIVSLQVDILSIKEWARGIGYKG
jgi:GH25 family lysozyme M1 (1,4-beta-N-acetylmuramidase)